MYTFPMNHNVAKFNMLGGDLLDLVLSIFDSSLLHFLQLNYDEHVVTGLDLLDWYYWHYAFT